MRQLILSPRWIVWHVLTLGAMATCGWLAAWQWGRAGSAMGSALNVGYGLQWPVFAVFFGVMWWRMLRMEAAALREGTEAGAPEPEDGLAALEPARPGAAAPGAPDPGPVAAGPVVAGPVDAGPVDARSVNARPSDPGPGDARVDAPGRPSPFGPRPASAVAASTEDDPELAAYNRMLARLAAHDSDH